MEAMDSPAVTAGSGVAEPDGGTGIVFDPGSGISMEEQREILVGIDRITERDRQGLSAGSGTRRFAAKKRGVLFPLLINAAAILFLAGGFLFLSTMHGKEEQRFRREKVVYSSTERALIEEIRRETARELGKKEREIDLVTSQLNDVDAELQSLQASVDAEAEERKANLRRLHDEYESALSELQDERAEILESARAREAAMKAQFEARAGELSAAAAESEARRGAARGELERLAGEQERAAAIDAQLSGFFTRAGGAIRAGNLEAASGILNSARVFLNTPAFQGMRSFQSRRELYTAAADTIEGMLGELEKNAALGNSGAAGDAAADPAAGEDGAPGAAKLAALNAELAGRNAALERQAADLRETVTALSGEGSNLGQMLAEARETAATLRDLNQALETANAERVATIGALQTQNGTLTRTVADRESAIAELRAQNAAQAETIENLNAQLATIRQALQALSQ
jgi:DNA repair exonuclease SbcCD ATPase subunit